MQVTMENILDVIVIWLTGAATFLLLLAAVVVIDKWRREL